MTVVFHGRPYGRFIEIKRNVGRKKRYRKNQGSNFLGGSFSNGDDVKDLTPFKTQIQFPHLKT